MILAKYHTNWFDEMDIDGFAVLTEEEWNEFQNKAKSLTGSFEYGVGTNQAIEYIDGEELLGEIHITEIDNVTAEIIIANLGKTYGFWPYDSFFDDILEENGEDWL